ncbi:MAG: hypothetical protein CMH59_02065, partial [Myxococcales bacterium]|nr:hypothetical protein [Myxococcales bacterium]
AALAATALGQGDVAAGLWRDLGIEARLSEGGMPIVEGVPEVRVRAPSVASGHGVLPEPERSFEVLWVAPTSPCHGVVISPSFRDCPVDWGDVVLWDGAPVSQDPPVFPLLEILREGDEHRFRFVALAKRGDVEKIVERLPEGVQAFAHPVGVEKDGDVLAYGKLVAPASVDLKALRGRFEAALAELRTMRLAMPELYEKTGPTKRAGQEHQAWRGIERVALKRGLVPEARADEERDDADAEEGGAA